MKINKLNHKSKKFLNRNSIFMTQVQACLCSETMSFALQMDSYFMNLSHSIEKKVP
uniref:Uncharacterized protein n=1 Tax=Nelumbo nucifera TaxID=4432 RepID=A0A822ZSV9_NELNU|nr:TPA_asm: hypothetical protein HUJ06_018269 [Nelumbo nucifera]